jgi:hypothetical protein
VDLYDALYSYVEDQSIRPARTRTRFEGGSRFHHGDAPEEVRLQHLRFETKLERIKEKREKILAIPKLPPEADTEKVPKSSTSCPKTKAGDIGPAGGAVASIDPESLREEIKTAWQADRPGPPSGGGEVESKY